MIACAVVCLSAPASDALAADPGRWVQSGQSTIPLYYYQGVSSDPRANFFFDGIYFGLYRSNTDLPFSSDARNDNVIPPDVSQREHYNHIGDLTWDAGEGGRVLLPMECYAPVQSAKACFNGAIGVADPCTLQWKYYVRLDPTDIQKAMWAEISPDGSLLWTEAGDGKNTPGGRDLIAYRTADIRLANAAPAGPLLKPVRRLFGVVPDSGITGATFLGGRLFIAGQDDPAGFQVWSIDLATGHRRLEIERRIIGESEGLDSLEAKGGVLHWMIQPYNEENIPTYGIANGTLLHFYPAGTTPPAARTTQAPRCFDATQPASAPGGIALKSGAPHSSAGHLSGPAAVALPQLHVSVSPARATVGTRTRFTFRVYTIVRRKRVPATGATVSFAGRRSTTNRRGVATSSRRFRSAGRYRATATKAGTRAGYSSWVRLVAAR